MTITLSTFLDRPQVPQPAPESRDQRIPRLPFDGSSPAIGFDSVTPSERVARATPVPLPSYYPDADGMLRPSRRKTDDQFRKIVSGYRRVITALVVCVLAMGAAIVRQEFVWSERYDEEAKKRETAEAIVKEIGPTKNMSCRWTRNGIYACVDTKVKM